MIYFSRHLIPECGDIHPQCSSFVQYCQTPLVRINGKSPIELCPYTCGKCPDFLSHFIPTTTMTTVSRMLFFKTES